MEQSTPHRIGIYLAVVQFVFTLTWTVYVIFLPKLAAQAGIPARAVVYILLLDQLVFVVMDYAMGVMSDRVSRVLGRLGYAILGLTLVSCAAFLLLPFAAPQGAASLFIVLTALWAITSSALRAPPLTLLGKYAAQPSVPWLSALSLFGLGLAGAVSPYLTIVLRDADPRLPFVASSLALAAATLGIIWAERTLAHAASAPNVPAREERTRKPLPLFYAAALLVGIGFQVHFSVNSAPLYLRHAPAGELQFLMPVFWIGFNVLVLPASIATRRFGGIPVASAGALVAALASLGALGARDLQVLIALQFIAGGGWGCVLMSAVAAAIALGRTGREGQLTGALFSLLALAAFARIAMLAAELNKDPQYTPALEWLPVFAWALGGLALLAAAALSRRPAR